MHTLALDDRKLQALADAVANITHVRRVLDLIGDEPLETCGDCDDARDTLRDLQEKLEEEARELLSLHDYQPVVASHKDYDAVNEVDEYGEDGDDEEECLLPSDWQSTADDDDAADEAETEMPKAAKPRHSKK